MRWIAKNLFRLAIVLVIGFVAYAFFAELPPPTSETVVALPLPKAAE